MMGKPPKNIDVSLTYDPAAQTWTMASGNAAPVSPKSFLPLKVPYGNEGNITFTITKSPNVTFAHTNPILVVSSTDPSTKPQALDPQFTVLSGNDQTKLVVKDLNGVPGNSQKKYGGGDFNYMLSFNGAKPIDPVITNGGCCSPTGNLNFFSSPIGLLVIALLVAVVVGTLLARRRTAATAPASSIKDSDAV